MTANEPKFPDVTVQLSGESSNAASIIERTRRALKNGGASNEDCEDYINEATAGSYDDLLRVTTEWVDVL